MYSRCFAGHLNLAPIGREGLPLAPQLAFMGSHSGWFGMARDL
jgi:hypothetical protein